MDSLAKLNSKLSDAARTGKCKMIAALLDKGADVNFVEAPLGWTPLMRAAYWGWPEACELLMKRGADPTVKSLRGNTAASLVSFCSPKDKARIIAALGSQKTA